MTHSHIRMGPGYPGQIISQIDGFTHEEAEKQLIDIWTMTAKIIASRIYSTSRIEKTIESHRKSFRSDIVRLTQSRLLEEHMGRFRIREGAPESFEKYRIFAKYETRRFKFKPELLRAAIMNSILLLERTTVIEASSCTISILTSTNYWTGGERIDFELDVKLDSTSLTIASYPRWNSRFDTATWELCLLNVKHFWSIIETILAESARTESENWKVEKYTIILDGTSPTIVPDETFAQVGNERVLEFQRALLKLKPELSECINPDGTIILK